MADERLIAQWLTQEALDGPRKSITVGPDRAAIIIADGVYGEPLIEARAETRKRIGGNVGGAKNIEVLRVDLTPFTITFVANETSGQKSNPEAVPFTTPVLTSDGRLVSGTVRLTLIVSKEDPHLLYQLRAGRRGVTGRDIAIAIRDEFQSRVIQPELARISSAELDGSSLRYKAFLEAAKRELESQLAYYGMLLQNFAPALLSVERIASAEQQQFDRRKQAADQERAIEQLRRVDAPSSGSLNMPIPDLKKVADRFNPMKLMGTGGDVVKDIVDKYTPQLRIPATRLPGLHSRELADFLGAEAVESFWRALIDSEIQHDLNTGDIRLDSVRNPIDLIKATELLIQSPHLSKHLSRLNRYPQDAMYWFLGSSYASIHKEIFGLADRYPWVWLQGKRDYGLRVAHPDHSSGVSLFRSKGDDLLQVRMRR